MFANLIRALRGATSSAPRRVLFIDDITAGDVEILPASELEWCREQMTAMGTAAGPASHGFNDATVRRPIEGAKAIADLSIPFSSAQRTLGDRLTSFDAVVTGDPNRPTPTRGKGYGPSPLSAVVIYAADGSEAVSALEVTLRGNAAETMVILSALAALPSREPLIAADWAGLFVAELNDSAAIARFAWRSG